MSIAGIPNSQTAVPPLQPGDRLNRAEFERRYHAMPDCKKAELIEGVVYVPSPARLRHATGKSARPNQMIQICNGYFLHNQSAWQAFRWPVACEKISDRLRRA